MMLSIDCLMIAKAVKLAWPGPLAGPLAASHMWGRGAVRHWGRGAVGAWGVGALGLWGRDAVGPWGLFGSVFSWFSWAVPHLAHTYSSFPEQPVYMQGLPMKAETGNVMQ